MSESLDSFREECAAWLEANCPEEMREPLRDDGDQCWGGRKWTFQSEAQRQWLERMAARGWTTPTWPAEYGGGGLSKEEAKILQEEMQRLGCRSPLSSFGISMLGPALLQFGSEELKQQHLPPIIRGEIRWCQGYSEPGAGSDLAGLSTKAVDKGDHYEVNGQKIWTSYGDKADCIFVLVRTDPEAPKHLGISFMLADMDQPGIEARSIRLISGKSDFCETFFDNARIEKGQIVGELNRGWDVAKYLLTHEREMIGELFGSVQASLSSIAAEIMPMEDDQIADKNLRSKIAEFEIDELAFGCMSDRIMSMAKAGKSLGATSAVLKYMGTELNKRRMELLVDVEGLDGASWSVPGSNQDTSAAHWLRSKGNSIEGGTSEVMLGIISKAILQLPNK